jgi:O-antigen ligase
MPILVSSMRKITCATMITLFIGVAGLSCVLNQPYVVTAFTGWCAYGAVAVAALLAAAWRADAWAIVPALFVATVLLSPDALPYSFGLLLFSASFILARSVRGHASSKSGRIAAGLTGLWCMYSIVRWYFDSVLPTNITQSTANSLAGINWLNDTSWPRILMPLGHANYTSGVGVILLPIFIGLSLLKTETKARRIGWAFFSTLALVLIFGGGSRAALLAPPVVLFAWVLLAPSPMISSKMKIGITAVGLIATSTAMMMHPHFRHWASNPDEIAYSDLIRRDYIEGAWAMFLKKPLTGYGAGSLPANFAYFNPPHAEYVSCYHAHNTLVQWLAEFGLLGILLFLVVAILCVAALHQSSRISGNVKPVTTGLVIAAAGYTLFSLFDYQANIPALGALRGASLGGISAFVLPARESRYYRGAQKAARVLLFAGAGYATLLICLEVPARLDVLRTKESLKADVTRAALHISEAAESAPGNAAIHGYAAIIYERVAVAKKSAPVAELADREWALAALAAPNFPQLKTYRALRINPTDPRKAIMLFKDSLGMGPKFPAAWRGLAEAYHRLGDRESAASVIALSLFVRPENAVDPALQSGGFGISTSEIQRRFDALVSDYAQEFPGDRFALHELAVAQKQIRTWYAAAGVPMDFVRANPDWSDKPAWRLLAKTLPTSATQKYDRQEAIRALTATVFASQDYTLSKAETEVLLDQYLGKSHAPFSGVRTVLTPEPILHFASYLGVGDLSAIGFPSYAREDLLAYLLLYEGTPPRIRADKRFLLKRVNRLP